MRPTRFGASSALFYLVVLAAFFATPYSNTYFLLLGFITLLGLFGVTASFRNLRNVVPTLQAVEPIPSGTEVKLRMRVRCPRPARHQLAIELMLEGGEVLKGALVRVSREAEITVESAGLKRGCHAIRHARLESSHPFGLVRVWRACEVPRELVVYPSPKHFLGSRGSSEALDELLLTQNPAAGSLQPSSLRDHREGDDLRKVHWRATARRGRPVVQEWEGGSTGGLEVLLDLRCAEEELEEALSAISALVQVAREGKETLRLHSQGHSETYGENQRPWGEALRFLAAAEPLPMDAPAPPTVSPTVMRLPRSSRVAA